MITHTFTLLTENQKIRSRFFQVPGLLFCLALLVIGIAGGVKKDMAFSASENRMLSEKPSLKTDTVVSGDYMKQYEAYRSDQFPLRNFWVSLKTNVDCLIGRREEHGVYIGKDHYLMEKPAETDTMAINNSLSAINSFKKRHKQIKMHMLLVPNAASILTDKLPLNAPASDQRRQLKEIRGQLNSGIDWIDPFPALTAHRSEAIYYRTDHHWTTLGAKYVFEKAAPSLGIPSGSLSLPKPCAVSNSFSGTLASTSGYEVKYKEPIYIYPPSENNVRTLVNYVEEQKKTASLYVSKKLNTKDQYGVFLGGNFPQINISTTASSKERLLLIKDSYANCFVPFMTPYFRKIVMIDPRYYFGNIDELIEKEKITRVLFLYNANTFFRDNNISGALMR